MPNVTAETNITAIGSGMLTAPVICPDMFSIPFIIVINIFITMLKAFIQSSLTRSDLNPVNMVVNPP